MCKDAHDPPVRNIINENVTHSFACPLSNKLTIKLHIFHIP